MKLRRFSSTSSTAILFSIVALISCDKTKDAGMVPPTVTTPTATETLIFKNGFEGTTAIMPRSGNVVNGSLQQEDLIGGDNLSTPSDWQNTLEKSTPYYGDGFINYEQGDYSQRRAELVVDPVNPANKVLRYRIADKHIAIDHGNGDIEYKTRIQYELGNKSAPPTGGYLKEYYQKCRVYFSTDFKVLEDAPMGIGWFVMQEFWNDPQWEVPGGSHVSKQARISVVLKRSQDKAGEKLHFGAEMEAAIGVRPQTWQVTNTAFDIPLGKWITQEIYVKEGNAQTGRFYMAVTLDGVKTVIMDKTGLTTSDAVGYVPDGQTAWAAMKVYTSDSVIKFFKDKGKTMDVYWDDLEIWQNKRP